MAEYKVASVSDFEDGSKLLVSVGGTEIGIFRLGDAFYAWRNVCPHQGGPVCQGRIFKRVIENIDADRKLHGLLYDETVRHIVCPWHGAEFDIRTGRHAGTKRLALDPIEAVVRNGEIVLHVD